MVPDYVVVQFTGEAIKKRTGCSRAVMSAWQGVIWTVMVIPYRKGKLFLSYSIRRRPLRDNGLLRGPDSPTAYPER